MRVIYGEFYIATAIQCNLGETHSPGCITGFKKIQLIKDSTNRSYPIPVCF